MPITKDDIKLLASERLTDDADGGGFMTANPITDGVENNLFPDISEIDRAQGAVDFRKAFVAVLADTSDTLFGAHVILDSVATDPAVSAVLCASSSISQTRGELITTLNSVGDAGIYYGAKALTVAGHVGDRSVQVDSIDEVLVPPSTLGGTVTGSIAAREDSVRNVRPYFGGGVMTTSAVPVSGGYVFYTHPQLGPMGIYSLVAFEGSEWLERDGSGRVAQFTGPGFYPLPYNVDIDGYAATLTVSLALQSQTAVYTPSSSSTRAYNTLHLPAEASESISWVDAGGETHTLVNVGPENFLPTSAGSASIDRTSGLVVVTFDIEPAAGSDVTIKYARADHAAHLPAPASPAPDGARQLTFEAGMTLGEAQFDFGGSRCRVKAPDYAVRQYLIDTSASLPRLVEGPVIGLFDPGTGELFLGGAGLVTSWLGVQIVAASSSSTSTAVTSSIDDGIEPTTLHITGTYAAGGTFDISPNSAGVFSGAATGTYSVGTGSLALTFSAAVVLSSLAFSGARLVTTVVGEAVAGVDPGAFESDGRVTIYRQGDIVVVHNTQTMAPAVVANAQTVSFGRTYVSDARVFGADGAEIFGGFTVNKPAGTITFTAVAGYSQPVTISHRVEDLVAAQTVDASGAITLSRGLTHEYPSGTSYVSSALVMGDLQARAHPGFQQATWTGTWSDSIIGSAVLADFNEAAYPIGVVNQGGITERWALIFTNTNSFRVIGEQVGEIGTGTTSTVTEIVNPATGAPYMTINPLAFGAGWAAGYVYRFNTTGGNAPFWTIRSIAPSEAFAGQDRITVAARGSINA
ncbi:hypothetical protein [Ideonella sp.]|uniref:hypothetical protein n=1 Tax=Ideonella sp. TaxID=1929293 RepID=UPI003BB6E1B1